MVCPSFGSFLLYLILPDYKSCTRKMYLFGSSLSFDSFLHWYWCGLTFPYFYILVTKEKKRTFLLLGNEWFVCVWWAFSIFFLLKWTHASAEIIYSWWCSVVICAHCKNSFPSISFLFFSSRRSTIDHGHPMHRWWGRSTWDHVWMHVNVPF